VSTLTSIGASLDRAAWAALSQDRSGVWSWPRAIVTIVGAMLCAVLIYVTIYPEPAFLAVLALVYAFLLFRARTSARRYGPGGVPRDVFIDRSFMIADEELGLTVTHFRPVK